MDNIDEIFSNLIVIDAPIPIPDVKINDPIGADLDYGYLGIKKIAVDTLCNLILSMNIGEETSDLAKRVGSIYQYDIIPPNLRADFDMVFKFVADQLKPTPIYQIDVNEYLSSPPSKKRRMRRTMTKSIPRSNFAVQITLLELLPKTSIPNKDEVMEAIFRYDKESVKNAVQKDVDYNVLPRAILGVIREILK